MNWGRVVHVFFSLMSLTLVAGYLAMSSDIALFVAMSVNLISTLLKIGVRTFLSAEIFASSLVADLHLIPAFIVLVMSHSDKLAYSLVVGAAVACAFSLLLIIVESVKTRDEF